MKWQKCYLHGIANFYGGFYTRPMVQWVVLDDLPLALCLLY